MVAPRLMCIDRLQTPPINSLRLRLIISALFCLLLHPTPTVPYLRYGSEWKLLLLHRLAFCLCLSLTRFNLPYAAAEEAHLRVPIRILVDFCSCILG